MAKIDQENEQSKLDCKEAVKKSVFLLHSLMFKQMLHETIVSLEKTIFNTVKSVQVFARTTSYRWFFEFDPRVEGHQGLKIHLSPVDL